MKKYIVNKIILKEIKLKIHSLCRVIILSLFIRLSRSIKRYLKINVPKVLFSQCNMVLSTFSAVLRANICAKVCSCNFDITGCFLMDLIRNTNVIAFCDILLEPYFPPYIYIYSYCVTLLLFLFLLRVTLATQKLSFVHVNRIYPLRFKPDYNAEDNLNLKDYISQRSTV